MTHRALPHSWAVALLIAVSLVAPTPAGAQGNGRPKNPKASKTTTSSSSTSPTVVNTTPETFAGVASFRQFGTWLEDASAPIKGEGYTNIGVGYWRLDGATQTNMPMVGAGLGLSERVGVSATVPFYRTAYDGGSARGIDDIYLGANYNVLDPALTLSEVGLSVGAVMEVLNSGATDGRIHFAVPVSMELRRAPFRVYGSVGYFTRGAVFAGSAIEWTGPKQFVLSGLVTQSRSIKADATLDSSGVSRQRADVMASVAHAIARSAIGYVSVGRSLTSLADGGTSLALNAGVAVRFSASRATP